MSHRPTGRSWYVWLAALAVLVCVFPIGRRPALAPTRTEPRPAVVLPAREPASGTRPVHPARRPADDVGHNTLFAYVTPPGREALTAALPAPSREIHYVRLNRALIAAKHSPFWQAPGAGKVALPLPDGTAMTVVIDRSEMLGADRFTSTGRIEGRPQSRAVFAYHAGFLHAAIEDPALGSYALRAATVELTQFYQIDPTLVLPCGGALRPDAAMLAAAETQVRAAGVASATPAVAAGGPAPDNPQRVEVHVMMVYTPAVLPTLAGNARAAALQSAFDAAIAKANAAFEASLITARLKLVSIFETQYDENLSGAGVVQDEALAALYKTDDAKMDEIHAARDRCGADVVCLALNRRDASKSGNSFLLDQPNSPANQLFAFSVVQYSNIAGTNVVPHELGHVFGCAHDRDNALSGEGARPYSFGYRFLGRDGVQYHDIMSYPPGVELGYFSNPDVVIPSPINAPIGVAPGQPGQADTALTIEQGAFAVSNYRLQTQTVANAGTLINVATRAFVGAGNQVLIAGFVVAGPERKQMLLRAAGPGLAGFGVAGALPDPMLRLYSGATPIHANDNWSSPSTDSSATPGEIAQAVAQVGAFPFVTGSRDAALFVTLNPGPYTAVVDGVGGTMGSALVEAYELDRNASKIVNVATRGYADNQGKELVAGFVVRGGAGSTKRILIRVLGPTLELAPFNFGGTLVDPYLELHGANGELLIARDDWSSKARDVAGERDDFQPLVRYYDEQQIAATGLAPRNRREPCVLLDLPPGNYTVVVRPFEIRSADPASDQPAQPGVALVEVYEINL